ncbi:hypothetical protein PTTG_26010 [Puccinia triticina 1-1 BBBD Race 1]|uniref:GCM domain-containing protein n=1 Tax=Puccinia triticina (isolate 1-1 / race 1 (BBBD)) TaxID=630390 RepID=A0A180GXY9_PUCT1|nr:hypothetical protein PTTG_26010 [Puccinia triticina 1-1 BBBD Race 1]
MSTSPSIDHDPPGSNPSDEVLSNNPSNLVLSNPLSVVTKWELPLDFASFRTFIDHGCTLDRENYPIYPNGATTFVKEDDQIIVNFGSVGFTKTTGVEKRAKGIWKVQRVYCLGVLVCDMDTCQWVGSPPTARGAIQEYIDREPQCPGAAGQCPGKVIWVSCNETATRFDFHVPSGWALLRHRGVHDHPWPESKKPDPLSRADLKAEIVKNPTKGALKLKMGQSKSLDDPLTSVTDIHSSLVNADCLRYYRRLMLCELNIVPDKLGAGVGDKFMMDMFQWNKRGLLVISLGFQTNSENFTFQTKWMADRLMARDQNNEVYQGGLISDVTYRFFENGYLLTTSMFCEQTARWIPVQLSWIWGLSTNYYKLHFTALLRQIVRPDLTPAERDLMVRQVVDFSLAQSEGFKAAYMEVFACTDPTRAAKMIKGCHQHFRAQVTRVRRNRSILAADQDADFQKKCMALLDPIEEGGPTHEGKIDEIRRLFPKTKRWLEWWTMSDVQAMLFPSCRPMLDDHPDGDDGLPDTTNAIESMHRVYYMISLGKKCLMVGMVELFSYINILEEEFNAVMCGISVEYGSQTKMQVNILHSMGWAKPTKCKFINDDPSTKKKNLGRPKNSPNVDRSEWSTYQSYVASSEEHLQNRCWMAADMESLFALYNPLWLRNSKGKGATLFYHLVLHFGSQTTFNITKIGRIKTVLTNGQSKLFKICNEQHQANFWPGAFALCDFFLELLLDPKFNPTKALNGLFELVEHRKFVCNSAKPCLDKQVRLVTTVKIERKMFQENNVAESNLQGLIDVWTTTGLSKSPGLVCRCESVLASKNKKPKSRGRPPKVKKDDLTNKVEVLSQTTRDTNHSVQYVRENSWLAFKEELPPQHIYFFAEVTSITDPIEQQQYMRSMDWPYQLKVSGEKYTLFSRGFWNGHHYWCKVVQSGRGSTTGVCWLFYSRRWTASEEKYVQDSISKISADHPDANGDTPFVNLGNLINPQVNSSPVSCKQERPFDDDKYIVDNFEYLEASEPDDNSDDDSSKTKSKLGEEDNAIPDLSDEETSVVSNTTKPLAKKTIKLKLKLPAHPAQESPQKRVADPAKQPKSPNSNSPPLEKADQPESSANEVEAIQRRSKRSSRK